MAKKKSKSAKRYAARMAKKTRLKLNRGGKAGRAVSLKAEVVIARNPNAKLRGRQVEACIFQGKTSVCASGSNAHTASANAYTKMGSQLRSRRSALAGIAAV